MKNKIRQVLMINVLALGMYLMTFGMIVAAEPSVVEITYDPQTPVAGSTVTFSATVSGEDITAVHIIVQECNEQICFLKHNISMDEIDSLEYQKEVNLTRDDATIVKYNLVIESNGVWYDFKDDIKQFDLAASPDNNQNNGNDGGNTPGFELAPFFIAIMIGALYIRRKRLR